MSFFTCPLLDRAVLSVTGEDRHSFLQGLVSNNIDNRESQPESGSGVFSLLLTPQGKVLYDFILWPQENRILIDMAAENRDELARKLGFYKLRANVAITPTDDVVTAFWHDDEDANKDAKILPDGIPADPRHPALGGRLVGDEAQAAAYPAITASLADYTAHRINQCVPQGQAEIPPDHAFPLEYGLHELNGIDFHKGCYIGQEVTSRSYRRGQVRKTLRRVQADALAPDAPVMADDRRVGEIRAIAGDTALALLRVDSTERADTLTVNGQPLKVL
jgi:folate-binding protein YgfZ